MSQQPYSLDALLKEHADTQGKLAQFESRQPHNPHQYNAYNAASVALEERVGQLRALHPRDRNLFDDLDFLMGAGHGI